LPYIIVGVIIVLYLGVSSAQKANVSNWCLPSKYVQTAIVGILCWHARYISL